MARTTKKIIISKQQWEQIHQVFVILFPQPKSLRGFAGMTSDYYRGLVISLGSKIFEILNIKIEGEVENKKVIDKFSRINKIKL